MAGTLSEMQAGAQKVPDILDKIDCDEVIDQVADMYVVPSGIVLGDDKVAEMRAQKNTHLARAGLSAIMFYMLQ